MKKKNRRSGSNRAERRKMLQAKPVEAGEDISNVVALFGHPLYKEFMMRPQSLTFLLAKSYLR